jgi:hypothetical protein
MYAWSSRAAGAGRDTARAAGYVLDVFFTAVSEQRLVLVPGVIAHRQRHHDNGRVQCRAGKAGRTGDQQPVASPQIAPWRWQRG